MIFLGSIYNQRNTLPKISYLDEYTTLADTAQIKIKKRGALLFCFFSLFTSYTSEKGTVIPKAKEDTKNQQLYPGILLREGKSHILGHSKTAKAKLQTQILHLGKQAGPLESKLLYYINRKTIWQHRCGFYMP